MAILAIATKDKTNKGEMSMSDGYLISTDGGCDMNATYDEMLDRWITSDDVEVIPSVGRTVYFVNIDLKKVEEEKVYALGKDGFLYKSFGGFAEAKYKNYYNTWFLDLDEALEQLARYLTDEELIEAEENGIWASKPL